VAASRGLTFTTAVRMVNRIHHHTSDFGTTTQPTRPTGFTQDHVTVLDISDLSQRCHTLNGNFADFT
jgi:hypothetical protein